MQAGRVTASPGCKRYGMAHGNYTVALTAVLPSAPRTYAVWDLPQESQAIAGPSRLVMNAFGLGYSPAVADIILDG
jgi:hypothetical protein